MARASIVASCPTINKEKTVSDPYAMLTVKLLSLGIRRNRGEVAKVIILASIGDRFQVFGITTVGDADTGDLPLLCHADRLLLFHNGIIGKLIPGDPAALFHKTDDPLRIDIRLRDLIQCIFDEIMVFHFALPLSEIVLTSSKDDMQKKTAGFNK